MNPRVVTRRSFLKTTAVVVGGVTLAGAGLSKLNQYEPIEKLPNYTYGEITMTNKILVTYASRTGSTAGVAEAIGRTLASNSIRGDVLPMTSVKDLTQYDAIVAGSAIQAGQWLPEATQFIRTNQTQLSRKPFAAFLVCMTLAMPKANEYRAHVATFMDPIKAMVKPVSEGLFAGSLDIEKIPSFGDRLKFRLSVMMGVWTAGDHRDWTAIQNWASSIAPKLLV